MIFCKDLSVDYKYFSKVVYPSLVLLLIFAYLLAKIFGRDQSGGAAKGVSTKRPPRD